MQWKSEGEDLNGLFFLPSKIMLVCLGLPEEELLRDCGLSTLLQGQSALLDCCSFCKHDSCKSCSEILL